MNIFRANKDDATILTALTMKSKAYWGFSTIQLEDWKEDLTITSDYIIANSVYKLVLNSVLIGYYSFMKISNNEVLLDNLFILPKYIGKGYGKILMNHFLDHLQSTKGVEIITLESEPKAEAFYSKFGFITIDSIETTIEGRYLAIMNKRIVQ